MRAVVSSSFFGFVTLAAVALGGCSFETAAEASAEASATTDGAQAGSVRAAPRMSPASEIEKPELGPIAKAPGLPTAMGQACSSDAECETGSCADGVCCDVACNGGCEACNVPGKVGSCWPVAAGTDPDGECGTPACYEGMQETFSCDGAGGCQVKIDSCGPYACGTSACFTDCRSDADCAAGSSCKAGRCE